MAGMSNCVPCHCQGTMHNWIPCTPCITNQFAQAAPTIPGCGCSGNSIRDTQLACLMSDVSKAFFQLRNSVTAFVPVLAVLDTQKPILIQALTDYRDPVTASEDIFERDEAVNGIVESIRASVDTLSNEEDYETIYKVKFDALESAINAYFGFVKGCC